MKRIFHFIYILIFILNFSNVQAQLKNNNDRPKLVVGIVVDQMRWDYLYKYYDRYNNNGFKRMLNQGFAVENTQIPYIPTYTAIGHSTIYTGSVPAIHGIAGNNFMIRATQKDMYCTQDDSVKGVGLDPDKFEGKMSPRNLLTTTITDELKLATDFKSKVVGISLKDRGGILPAGHFADAAYWMVDGNWVSSTFYMNDLPGYVRDFNKADLTKKYLDEGWSPMYPLNTYFDRVKDDNPYEGSYVKGEHVRFPINLKDAAAKKNRDVIKSTPFGNTVTLKLAQTVLTFEKMGKNPANVPDFMAISLSSTDYIGHQFAINSAKIEDTYLRLDKDLADFFSFLDNHVGKGNYTVFLTADHGAAHNPQYIADENGNGGFLYKKELGMALEEQLIKTFGHKKLVYTMTNNQVFLDYKLIDSLQLDDKKIKQYVINFLKKQDGVAFAADMEQLSLSSFPEPIKSMSINGYNYKRSGDIQVILEPQWYGFYKDKTGTTHGAWNPYDSHIPLVFMGWGIRQGNSHAPAYMTDIAPTLAALLHIQEPNGNIGKPLIDVLR
ncbi:MAG TPA: alkaline phosphatase family protein [Saprospiraceae bacterium]|nr:alkaline phosphatase family protein [Saprospiraceae bacterium]HRP42529.1 alkaline phosphatase family protein [Saprospiraceae bacterium]